MMYRFMEKKNPVFLEYHQVKARMTMYTLAMLYHVTNGSLSLYKIWQNQCLSEPLKEFINELSRQLYEKLMRDCPPTTTFRDFCKSPKTWEAAGKYTFTLDMASIADDLKRPDEEKARKLASKSDNENERKEVESYGAAFGTAFMALRSMTSSQTTREKSCLKSDRPFSAVRCSRRCLSLRLAGY